MSLETTPIAIHTLGRLSILIDAQPLRFPGRAPQRALQLLNVLVSLGGRAVSLGTVADTLWPEADPLDAQRSLTITLFRLRRLLRYAGAVRLSAGKLSIDPQICSVDIWKLEKQLRAARCPAQVLDALELYRGEFLGDEGSPWALATRRRLATLVCEARKTLQGPKLPQEDRWRLAVLGSGTTGAELTF